MRRAPLQERCYRQLRRVPAEESGMDPAAEDREPYLSLLRSRAVAVAGGGGGADGGPDADGRPVRDSCCGGVAARVAGGCP
ncbi:hypothetical protein GCM10010502_20920 [Kitasatospora aureofaciens]|uniref:Uncharacterized protein n=1 Tax=Kitasatospora aureofaciens TaxID=1894 RepID=A0A8H9HJV0_KITAU|nr:hypothetical protein GCM10010502_20920 [Kitasatospora aureofaciens]